MKKAKSLISLALCLIMVIGLAVPALADNEKKYYDYDHYLCIGDSIAAGCGLTKDGSETVFEPTPEGYAKIWGGEYITHGYDFAPVPTAYHSIVAEAIDAELWQLAVSGLRTVELRYILDGTYNDYDTTCSWGNTYFDWDKNGFSTADLDYIKSVIPYIDCLTNTDLLTLNLGSNDVFSYSFGVIMAELYADDSDPRLDEIKAFLDKTGNIGAAFGKLFDLYKSTGKIAKLLNVTTQTFAKTLKQYTTNYDVIMKLIYEMNPDITVVNVGVYNPMQYMKLSENFDVSPLLKPIVDAINAHLKGYSSKYSNCYYADVVGTETYPTTFGSDYFWEYFSITVHPNLAGHKFMAEQILKVIPEAPPLPFTDVSTDSWYYDDVRYCYKHGIVNGVTETTYAPNMETTRAQLVTVLYRMAGSPNVDGLNEPFTDVSDSSWYHDAVVWAYNTGVVNGVSATKFAPNQSITRAQFVTMLYRYAESPAVSGSLSFTDADKIAACYADAVLWASQNGIVKGYNDGSFGPNRPLTRAEMSAIIARYCQM